MCDIPRYELILKPAGAWPNGETRAAEYRVIDKTTGAAIGWMATKTEALEYLGSAAFEDNTL